MCGLGNFIHCDPVIHNGIFVHGVIIDDRGLVINFGHLGVWHFVMTNVVLCEIVHCHKCEMVRVEPKVEADADAHSVVAPT